jgi:DNA-directed RNA polymerase
MVYTALNAVQDTAWTVNDRVLWAMHQVWEQGGGVAGLPPVNAMPHYSETEPKPVNGTAQEIRDWNIKAERVHTENARLVGKRLSFLSTLLIADEYQDRTFYFPHTCDFRGRMYPLPTFLHPQSNDVARGLLLFDEAKPLGKDGFRWLKIHVANCFGIDKCSYDDRVDWVDNRLNSLCHMAAQPLEYRGWMDADKPWQALAALTELHRAILHPRLPSQYPCSLPVSVDGSNSGLQHFSAMLRDERGAKLVNLGPSLEPSDIYTDVANWVETALDEALRSGQVPESSELLGWTGRVNRKLCKRGTMTYCYGVTQQGLDDALIADGLCDWADNRFSASRSIGKLIWQGIQANITGAAEAMAWLKKVASKANKWDVPLEWWTPSGFHVVHPYHNHKLERIVCMSSEVGFYMYDPDGGICKHKQANSIAPNFVHSLDASHLMMVVASGAVLGITHWMMIHDSFGTHACDVTLLQQTLKEEFVKLYSLDVLESFRRQAEQQCNTMMPDPPEMGSFNLEAVYDSDYS